MITRDEIEARLEEAAPFNNETNDMSQFTSLVGGGRT